MNKRKVEKESINPSEVTDLQTQYNHELDTNPKYSLDVDPEDKYKMPYKQKQFIAAYVQFKNVPIACQLCGIDEQEGKSFFMAYSSQQEIRRINLAMYHRQFAARLLTIDEIGGYLTSLLTDQNVPLKDQLESRDKIRVAQMIIDLNKLKAEALSNPEVIEAVDITDQIKNLSVNTIKNMLNTASKDAKEKLKSKDEVIRQLTEEENLSPEEIAYLRTLPLDKILEIVEKGSNDDNQ